MIPMELRSKVKVLFFALAVCIAFSIISAETLAADDHYHDHDCIGEECPFCLAIEATLGFLKILSLALLTLFLAARLSFPAQTPQKFTGFVLLPYSPIALKVRSNT